ncbi:protein yippee-like At4g27745 [Vigna umbellata]|nr:protein yippee-like At4g27745 [Vigna umbellata]
MKIFPKASLYVLIWLFSVFRHKFKVYDFIWYKSFPGSFFLNCRPKFYNQGRNGRAFLFSHAMNVVTGPKEDRHLLTGLHTVADVYCGDCREVLGWKYERAYEASQRYKEGKFILEKSKIVKDNW